ncbi:hypothetical protein BJF81_00835 [Ornithinimicrobium sp. CNJ-824]|nr:hypothetical protein BJF81_00835 [Ornithinimicrobium sp. CNJ-824]
MTTATRPRNTTRTAGPLVNPLRVSHCTTGSSARVTNRATSRKVNTEVSRVRFCTSSQASRAPRAKVNPT